ncbi:MULTISPECIES: hypothetical protein [unclassified Rhizobium]|uniref:hypothetical protein n=1 Tax=unclassified Rhizobium TaxID=2613769 RepID=UPI00381BAE2F
MTAFIDIKPGQWVLAFDQPYGPYQSDMPKHLERFAQRGGGWDSHHADEIFIVHLVDSVAPKTYQAQADIPESWRRQHAHLAGRYYRACVIAAGASRDEMIALRNRFFAIGEEAGEAIEKEMYRRIEKFAERKRAAAERKIHWLLPQHFRGQA